MKTGIINYYLRLKDYPTRYSLSALRLGEYLNSSNIDVDIFPIPIETDDYQAYAKEIDSKYDIVAISHYVWSQESTEILIQELKKINPNKKIIVGGPEVIYIDLSKHKTEYFIAGEGEDALVNIIKYIETGETDINFFKDNPNIFNYENPNYKIIHNTLKYKKPLFTKFSNIDKEFLYYETSRGCAYNCGYCGFKNRFEIANFDLEFVKEEVKRIGELKFKEVFVIDANFGGTKERAKKIMKYFNEYAPDSLLTIYLRPEFIDDEFIEILTESNLKEIRIGIQTTNPKIPHWVRNNSLNHIINELPKLSPNGIKWKAELIIGLPGDTLDGLKQSIDFVETYLKPTEFCCYPLTIIKATKMHDILNKTDCEFWLKKDENNMACESNSYNFEQLKEMQQYAIFRMNKYLDNSYKQDDKVLKKKRNQIIYKSKK